MAGMDGDIMNESIWTNISHITVQDEPERNWPVRLVAGVFLFCFVENIFIIFIIKRTLKSYTRTLLISQTVSDACIQFLFSLLIIPRLFPKEELFSTNGLHILSFLACAFQGITCQTFAATSINLYFAICHSAAYRKRMTKRHVAIFVLACWIFNLLLCAVFLAPDELRSSLLIKEDLRYLPNYTGRTVWAWSTIVIIAYVIPAIVTSFAFIKIRKYSQKIQPLPNTNLHYREKYQLSQVITGISIFYIGVWSLIHVFLSVQGRYKGGDTEHRVLHGLSTASFVVNMAYDASKLGVYMCVYRPIRDTVVELFRRNEVTPVREANQGN